MPQRNITRGVDALKQNLPPRIFVLGAPSIYCSIDVIWPPVHVFLFPIIMPSILVKFISAANY